MKIRFQKGDVVIFSTRALHALYPLFKEESNRRNYSPLKLLGVLFMEGYSRKNEHLLKHAINNINEDDKLIKYASYIYNLRLYNTTVDHQHDASNAIKNISGLPMGLNRDLELIQASNVRDRIQQHNLIHDFYKKHYQEIDAISGKDQHQINDIFLNSIQNHTILLSREGKKLSKAIKQINTNQPIPKGGDLKNKDWDGLAKFLPMINNEDFYLFYKRVHTISKEIFSTLKNKLSTNKSK